MQAVAAMAARCFGICVLVVAVAVGCCLLPAADSRSYAVAGENDLTIVSFNIRYASTAEADASNNWPQRLPRMVHFVEEFSPWVLGLQEALPGQVVNLKALLPHYEVVAYDAHADLHPYDERRHRDWQTCILYDARRLVLMAKDHIWLSETPRVEGSKSWGSRGVRTLTIAAFETMEAPKKQVIVFNTHLDVWSAPARHGQAKRMQEEITVWTQRFPDASVFATGDFNSANGQKPHGLLTRELEDSWVVCAQDPACSSDTFAVTFHGWWGTRSS
eukprot:TRINITY_DN31679_c0_g1_i1.p1 TRINITY_DN31679_c0_g1~~TRINITY_DN31679_c0_g1_i1.p1  ORF type:complete len:274 (+),score=38.40 TRINITY_DN31679_c0_g1_i1:58-879(+)